jgi:long-chain acyl-CoA synthetase
MAGIFITKTMPVIPASVARVLDAALAAAPDREALVTRRGRWSYAELDRLADQAANVLAGMGIGPGDRVAAALPNDVDIVAAFHGAMRIGAVWVGVNRALAPVEMQHILDDAGVSLFLCDAATAERTSGRTTARIVDADTDWAAAIATADDTPPAVPVDPFAPAAIAYTSGTTGLPKGAVHSQHNLVLPGAATVASRNYTPSLRKGDCLPLTILNMQVLTTVLVAQAGGCAVIMDRIDAAGVAGWIRDERVTTWNGPPALLRDLATFPEIEASDLASLDEVWSGGADCPEELRSMFAGKFGTPVLTTYGLTEAPTLVAIDGRDGIHVPGASGRPLPHLDVRIVDGPGADLAPGETGEICVGATRSGEWAGRYRPMLGYWHNAEATAKAVHDGWLHTGDLGYRDGEGNLFVRDRKNQMIIRGGANVYPAEVERVLQQLPAVEACAVIGLPHQRLGEQVAAAVQLRDGAACTTDELAAHCRQNLARYKVPERWVVVDGFARNSMGKVDRRSLTELF